MQLPVKAHYATLAMLALAEKADSREPLPARVIAREQKIPMQFLGQILQQLRAAGLITSSRGANGGFLIAKSPSAISVGEIVETVCCGPSSFAVSDSGGPYSAIVGEVWEELYRQQRESLANLKLSQLLSRCEEASPMFYI